MKLKTLLAPIVAALVITACVLSPTTAKAAYYNYNYNNYAYYVNVANSYWWYYNTYYYGYAIPYYYAYLASYYNDYYGYYDGMGGKKTGWGDYYNELYNDYSDWYWNNY